ncbi:hypothetical protein HGRIS_005351 [Hohenbuehelia grisea]|uniref:NAD(P)-binding protein n=1 Tax=Hohenbuehelia grisea TaxID=104357 RepID=A0ABR3JFN0_9AGAR
MAFNFRSLALLSIVLAFVAVKYPWDMATLAALKASHAAQPLVSPVAVFVGGTAGLGAALAITTARYSKNPSIYIVGRSQTSADKVIAEMKAVNPDGKYGFHQCDVSLLANVRSCADTISTTLPKINYLVLSPGILSTAGRTETTEGNDFKMTLHYYSRMLFAERLLPNLEAATASGSKAHVVSILDSLRGDHHKLNWDDLDLKTHFSLGNAAQHCMAMTDVSIQRFARLHPTIAFTHSYPSLVATEIGRGLPWYARGPATVLAKSFGASSQDVSEYFFEAMVRDATGPHFIDNKGKEITKVESSDEVQEKVWSHTQAIFGV